MLSQFRMETSVIFRRVSVGFTSKFWWFHVLVLQRKAMKYTHFLKKTHALNNSSFVLPLTHCSCRHDLFKVPKIWQSFISFDLLRPHGAILAKILPISKSRQFLSANPNSGTYRMKRLLCSKIQNQSLLSENEIMSSPFIFSLEKRNAWGVTFTIFFSKRKLEGWCVKTAQPYKGV